MADFITLFAIVIVALSPILQRLYIQRFWIPARGTVARVEGEISTMPGAAGSWVWTPLVEYHIAGQKFSSPVSYWQSFNAKSKYKVGDEVEILYSARNPSRFVLNSWESWITYIFITILIGSVIVSALASRAPSR